MGLEGKRSAREETSRKYNYLLDFISKFRAPLMRNSVCRITELEREEAG